MPIKRLFRLVIVAVLIAIVLAGRGHFMAHAQEAPVAQDDPYANVVSQIAAVQATLGELAKAVDKAALDDATLADLKLKAEMAGKQALAIGIGMQGRYGLVTKRLTELGDPPGEDKPPEAADVTADRTRLVAEKARINSLTAQAEAASTQASDLVNHITDIRRELFKQMLFQQTTVSPAMVSEMGGALLAEGDQLSRTVTSWAKFVWSFKRSQLVTALVLSLISALVLVSGLYRIVDPLTRRPSSEENPPYITRLALAFWSTVLPTLSIWVFLLMSVIFLVALNVLRPDITVFLSALLTVFLAVYFAWRLSRSILAPDKPQWRLVNVSDRGARMLVSFAVALAAVNALDFALEDVSRELDAPVVLTIGKSLIGSVLIGGILFALSFVRPMSPAEAGGADRPWPRPIRSLLRLAGVVLILMAAFGYMGLARFVASQIIFSGAIIATMYIGLLSGKAISRRDAFAETVGGRYLANRFGLSEIRLDQIGLATGILIYLLIIMAGLPLILIQWGFQIHDIQGLFITLLTEIKIGNITISIVSLIGGVVVFVLGLFFARWFQRWLDGNVMERSQFDAGVRNSVNTALGYAGVAMAGILGVSAAGIDLSSLALVAGALSLGIGFGLQTIVSNFVSGLILLAERPFKVGDWVVTGKTEGFVKRISVRATEIETFQNQSIIVPNSELINSSLGNWTHRNSLGRSEIQVGVSYDSDPRKVMDILLEIARAHPLVLMTPEPVVAFLRFGDFSLDFELRFHLADLLMGNAVRNDLRLAIIERFRADGIEIPFPQRNLNIRFSDSLNPLEEALEEEGIPPELADRIRAAAERRRKAGNARPMDRTPDGDELG